MPNNCQHPTKNVLRKSPRINVYNTPKIKITNCLSNFFYFIFFLFFPDMQVLLTFIPPCIPPPILSKLLSTFLHLLVCCHMLISYFFLSAIASRCLVCLSRTSFLSAHPLIPSTASHLPVFYQPLSYCLSIIYCLLTCPPRPPSWPTNVSYSLSPFCLLL